MMKRNGHVPMSLDDPILLDEVLRLEKLGYLAKLYGQYILDGRKFPKTE